MFAFGQLRRLGMAVCLAVGVICVEPAVAVVAEPDAPQVEEAVPVPLDPHMVFERVIMGPDGVARSAGTDEGGVAGAGERLIYSNTLGIHAVNFPTNQPVSDDIATTAPDGCALTRYRFKVLGKVVASGLDGAYTVNYGLYTTCPSAVGGTNAQRDVVRIPGTEGQISFPDDGPRMIEHVVSAQTPVALPTNVYLGIRFDRSNCGTVVGAPAMIGFSGDIWDSPGFPCNVYLGGFPELPHASFWLEMFGSDQCADAFVGYKAEKPSGQPIAAVGFGDVQRVDDARLIVDDCQMVSYEIAVKGVGFNFFDLRRTCDSQIIEGTQRVFNLASNTVPSLQVVRFNFDPPIPLNTDEVYLGFKNSSNSAGAVVTQIPPIIGESSADYWTQSESGCATVPRNELVHGAINLAITCAGTLPLGACCDPYLTECDAGADAGKRCNTNTDCASPGTCEAVCRETTKLNCPRRAAANPQWVENEVCGPDAFGKHACGIAACCHRTDDDDLVCENLTKNECNQTEPTDRHWQLGRYCGEGAQFCPITDVCLDTVGSCFESRETPGCDIYSCCALVCSLGPTGAFCCEVAWDSVCVALVETHEPYCPKQQCPVGEVDFVEPPNSVVDARRPYPPDSPQATEGIKAIVATGPIGATADCWSICESPAVPASIQIARVDEAPPGIYTVQLNRTITPGAVTMLTYMDSESHKTVGRFIAHPGNVNGDSRMNAYDILVLVDFLNGVSPLPWGLYSGDLDHSGVIAPTDILTLIDLLNGTNGFAEWYGTALPDVEECP